jgi:hypothetical protein
VHLITNELIMEGREHERLFGDSVTFELQLMQHVLPKTMLVNRVVDKWKSLFFKERGYLKYSILKKQCVEEVATEPFDLDQNYNLIATQILLKLYPILL